MAAFGIVDPGRYVITFDGECHTWGHDAGV
jgi:hypothetical protein